MAGRRFMQILALVGLLGSVGCAAWCQHHFGQQCCAPCCCQCAPAAGYAPAPAPTWAAPATPAACTCGPPVGR
jgi:hypothetical protein